MVLRREKTKGHDKVKNKRLEKCMRQVPAK